MSKQPAEATVWTVAKVLSWAADDFRARNIDSPRLDAELLLGHVLGVERLRLILDATRPLVPEELSAYRALILRRRGGEPIAYTLGQREFYGLNFAVDSRVLIPRPDTETLVDVALGRTAHRALYGRALDLCTGSGCVAIALSRQRPTWRITGTDLSADAITLARKNALGNGAVWGVSWHVGDGFDAVDDDARFELITGNPPYIPSQDIQGLERQVREFEPRIALDGGADGLELIRRLIPEAVRRLTPGGILALEMQYDQGDALCQLFEAAGLIDIERAQDYGQRDRVVSGRAPDTT